MDFFALARGGERSYSTSYLSKCIFLKKKLPNDEKHLVIFVSYVVNLDPDLLTLCAGESQSAFDLCLTGLIGHTNRVFRMVQGKSKRNINQFCFGSTFIQLNPNYRKFDRMDPMTWKKEGIASHWTGMRGLRKKCCKVCCDDTSCSGISL